MSGAMRSIRLEEQPPRPEQKTPRRAASAPAAPILPASPHGLTTEELILCRRLSECWDDFLHLTRPRPRDDDRRAFLAAIQTLQRIVMARAPRRAHPEVFRS